MSKDKSVMIVKWVKEVKTILRKTYPNADKQKILEYVFKLLKENYTNEEIEVYNNYEETRKKSTMADIENFYYSPIKPIATEHGTFFRRDVDSPAALMLAEQYEERKKFKKMMYTFAPGSAEYNKFNLKQLLKKISMNSYYGASGAKTSIFYNIHCATAITGKGQAIISTATQTFESFLTNSSYFLDDTDCIIFIKNCIEEAKSYNPLEYANYVPTLEMVMDKLEKTYEYKRFTTDSSRSTVYNYIKRCSPRELAMIYYKNNLYKFITRCPEIQNLLEYIVRSEVKFVDSNEVPMEFTDALNIIWDILYKCVYYKHMSNDRIYRLKYKERRSVMIIDTDSNMINMKPWTEFTINTILNGDLGDKSFNDIRYSALSTISYILGQVISGQFYRLMKYSNVKKEKRGLLAMKNEYLYKRMLISSGKKNYVGVIEYKEGKFMDYELDVKGLPIDKISSNAEASNFFKDIVKNDILMSDEIDVASILKKLQSYQNSIITSLELGEKTFLKPVRVKEEKYYADPLSQQSTRAAITWNLLNEYLIEAPDNVSILKLKCTKMEDLQAIKFTHPDMFEKVKREIFMSDIPAIRSKGLYVIAIPRNLSSIPKWLIPFIDIDTIVHDTMKNIVRILESLGLKPIAAKSSDMHFGNIVKL